MTDLISIIIPVYNQEKYLAETLNSVISQSYSNWECILVNDGSRDDSVNIIKQYVKQDNRFQFINSENKGVSHARNLALNQVKGDFVLFLDGDDLIHPEKLQKTISSFEENKDLSIVFNQTIYFQDTIKNTLYPFNINPQLLNFNDILLFWNEKIIIPIHSAIIKRTLLDEIKFNTELTAQEDWLVWLQLFKKNPNVKVLDEVLSYYRKHDSSRTQSFSLKVDHFKALQLFEKYIGSENHKKLLIHQIERYYTKANGNAFKLNEIRRSKTYRVALFAKNLLLKFKILGIIKFLSSNFFKDEK